MVRWRWVRRAKTVVRIGRVGEIGMGRGILVR